MKSFKEMSDEARDKAADIWTSLFSFDRQYQESLRGTFKQSWREAVEWYQQHLLSQREDKREWNNWCELNEDYNHTSIKVVPRDELLRVLAENEKLLEKLDHAMNSAEANEIEKLKYMEENEELKKLLVHPTESSRVRLLMTENARLREALKQYENMSSSVMENKMTAREALKKDEALKQGGGAE